MATKKIVKKAAPKKAAVKKSTPPKLLWHLPDNLGGWEIERKGDVISFGCGEVKISKKDLKAVAAVIPSLRRLATAWQNRKVFTSVNDIMGQIVIIDQKVLNDIAGN